MPLALNKSGIDRGIEKKIHGKSPNSFILLLQLFFFHSHFVVAKDGNGANVSHGTRQ